MKVRDSGMPKDSYWDSFFDAKNIVSLLFNQTIIDGNITEFGSGYGTFTMPASKMTKATLYALDIESYLIKELKEKAKLENINNIEYKLCDFIKNGTKLDDNSQEHVMIYNLLHLKNPIDLLSEAKRILKQNGTISIMHWRSDIQTPRGPSLDIRPTPEQSRQWLHEVGFSLIQDIDLKDFAPFHYGIIAKIIKSRYFL